MTKRKRRPAPPASPPTKLPADEDVLPEVDDSPRTGAGGATAVDRVAAISGLVFSVLALAGLSFIGGNQYDIESPAKVIADELVDHRASASAGVLLMLVGLFFLLVFVTYVHRLLRTADGEGSWLPTLALGGGLLLVAAMSMMALTTVAAIQLDDYREDVAVAKALLLLQSQAVVVAFVPASALVGGISLVARRAMLLPQWLTSLGLVLAAGLLVIPVGLLPFTVSLIWIGAVSLILFRRTSARWRGRTTSPST